MRRFAVEAGRQGLRFSTEARAVLASYGWPGNVRELANIVERAVVLAVTDDVGLEVLPEEIVDGAPTSAAAASATEIVPYHDAVAEAKRAIIRDAFTRTSNHQTRAAELLGLGQPYLARLMKNLGLRN